MYSAVNYRTVDKVDVPDQQANRFMLAGAAAVTIGMLAAVALATSSSTVSLPITNIKVGVQRPVIAVQQPLQRQYLPPVAAMAQDSLAEDFEEAVQNENYVPARTFQVSHVFSAVALGVAAVAALATAVLRKASPMAPLMTATSDVANPLALSDYQSAEAKWAMMAATAFVGTKAPDFQATAVYDEEFVDVKLSSYRGKKYVVLFFYPLDFTFVCPTEITAFSDRMAEFSAIDTEVLGVSVDSQFSHLAWVQTPRNQGGLGEIAYPLVSDLKKEISEAYGVLTEDGVALRGLFIIDKEGIIQHATINNLAFGRNVDETLRVLEAVQHVQAHPDEVCPAGWKKGDKTMKPDPEGSKEYFAAI